MCTCECVMKHEKLGDLLLRQVCLCAGVDIIRACLIRLGSICQLLACSIIRLDVITAPRIHGEQSYAYVSCTVSLTDTCHLSTGPYTQSHKPHLLTCFETADCVTKALVCSSSDVSVPSSSRSSSFYESTNNK